LKVDAAMKAYFFAALFLVAGATRAEAGCPAMRPVNVDIKVESCRFYDAAADGVLRKKVEDYFHEGWDNKTPADLAERRAETLRRNTGLMITGTTAGAAAAGTWFLRTSDAKGCEAFTPATTYEFTQHATCVMIFFEAPASMVLTYPASPPEDISAPSTSNPARDLKQPE